MSDDYVSILIRVAKLLRLNVEFSRVKKLNQDDQFKYLHEAKIIKKSSRTVGLGLSSKISKQDAARKMLYIVFRNDISEILTRSQPEKKWTTAPTLNARITYLSFTAGDQRRAFSAGHLGPLLR